MTQETRRTHVRVYDQTGKILVAMDADVDGNQLARDVFDLINGYRVE